MRPCGKPEQLEKRRIRAVGLLQQGHSLAEVARRVGCRPPSVLRWRNEWRRGGEESLRPKPTPGRPPRLKDRQKNQLVALLLKGPLSNGYRNDLWTTRRIVQVIERRMGIHYHYNHVGKLLHRLGWSHQKPERRAIERDEEAIKEWKRSTWPAVKKTRGGWAPTSCSSTNPASC